MPTQENMDIILLIEDDAGIAELMRETLAANGLRVVRVSTGREASAWLESNRPQLVLLDYSLPDMNGAEFVERMGTMPPFIVTTGMGDERIAVAMMKQGARDYLVKDRYFIQNLPVQVEHILREIATERQLAEAQQELRESEHRYRTLLESSPLGVIQVDSEMRIVYENLATKELFGVPPGQESRALGMDIRTVPSVIRAGFDTGLNELALGKSILMSAPFESIYGSKSHLNVRGVPLYKAKQFEGALILLEDITERKRAEQALAASESELRALFASMQDVVLVIDRQGVYRKIAPTNPALLVKPPEELLGMNLRDVFPAEQAGAFLTAVRQVLETRQSVRVEYELLIGKRPIWFAASISPMDDENTVWVARDITERKRTEEQIRLLADLSDISPATITVYDLQGNFLYANQRTFDLHGYTRDEFLGINLHELDLPASADLINARMEMILKTGVAPFIVEHYKKDGTTLPLEVFVKAMQWGGKEVFLSVGTDITARKQSEEALRASEERFHTLYDNATIGLYRTTPEGRILMLNPAGVRMLGYGSFDEIVQRDLEDPEFQADRPRKEFREKLEHDGIILGLERKMVRKDGSVIFVRESAKVFRDKNGKALYYDGSFEDVTERKQAEDALQASEKRFKALIENGADLIVVINAEGSIQFASPSVEPILGYRPNEVIGDSFLKWVHPDDLELAQDSLENRRVTPGTAEASLVVRGRHKDGNWRTIEAIGTNLIHDPAIRGIVLNMRDITERKRVEAEREALFEIMQGLTATQELQEFLQLIHRTIARVIYAKNFFVAYYNKDTGFFEELYAVDQYDPPSPPAALQKSLTAYVFRTQKPHLINQADFEELAAQGEVELVGANSASWLGVPLNTPTGTIGVITVQDYENPNRYSNRDRGFLESVASQIALAIERKHAEQRIQDQLARLNALHTIDTVINSSFDVRTTFEILLEQVAGQLQVDAVALLLLDKNSFTLEYKASRGFLSMAANNTKMRLGEGHAGRVVLDRKTIHIPNLAETTGQQVNAFLPMADKFVSYFGVPLVAKGQIVGVLEIFHRSALHPNPDWLNFMQTLADQAAIAIDNAQLFENLQRSNFDLTLAYDATIEGWSRAMDLRDEATEGHTQRVTTLTLNLARQMSVRESELIHIRRGALLHDIGKLGVPDNILLKPGKFTDAEWEIMRRHPVYAYEMLTPITYLKTALDIPYCHHERWDGTGYPRGLKAEHIPLAARIFAIVDVYDALTSDRSYRKAWPKARVLKHIKFESGKHFEPRVVDTFLEMLTILK